jgi:two-component sensor histidine kinase
MNDDIDDGEARAAAELRHRTANIFQLLSALARMRSQRAGEPEARRQLLWMADAIGSLGALERQRRAAGVDLALYLAEMAPVWRRRHGAVAAEVVVDCAALLVPDTAASTLALIAQELVGNALTHGYPDGRAGKIHLSLAPNAAGGWDLVVADDGCGFDPAAARERFGLWFVRSLVSQVRGELILTSQPSVTARLAFKV